MSLLFCSCGPRAQPRHTVGARCLLNDNFGPAKWDCEETLNMRTNSGDTVRGGEKWVLGKSPGLLTGTHPSSPHPKVPLTRPNPGFGEYSRVGFRLEGAKKAN